MSLPLSLSPTDDVTAQTAFQTVITAQHVTALTNAVTNWATLTAVQKDTVQKQLCIIMIAIMQAKFAVMT